MQKLLFEATKILPKDTACGTKKRYVHLPFLDSCRKFEILTNTIDILSLLEVNKCDLETLEIDIDTAPTKTKCSKTSATASADVCPEITDDIVVIGKESENDNSNTTRTAPECSEYIRKFQKNYVAEDIILISSHA